MLSRSSTSIGGVDTNKNIADKGLLSSNDDFEVKKMGGAGVRSEPTLSDVTPKLYMGRGRGRRKKREDQ